MVNDAVGDHPVGAPIRKRQPLAIGDNSSRPRALHHQSNRGAAHVEAHATQSSGRQASGHAARSTPNIQYQGIGRHIFYERPERWREGIVQLRQAVPFGPVKRMVVVEGWFLPLHKIFASP